MFHITSLQEICALSRALGDFAFKRNEDRRPEDQIITGVLCYATTWNVLCRCTCI